jgi:hypothetical protein
MMSKRVLQSMAALVVCAAMMTGSVWAQGRGHGRGVSGANHAWRGDNDGDRGGWRNSDWRGDRDRWTFGNDPRGWEKGKKTGWGDCDLPPGQAKKMGCTPASRRFGGYTRHNYVRRDRDRDRDRRVSGYRNQRDRRYR